MQASPGPVPCLTWRSGLDSLPENFFFKIRKDRPKSEVSLRKGPTTGGRSVCKGSLS